MRLFRYEIEAEGARYGVFNAPKENSQLTEEEQWEYWDAFDKLESPEIPNALFFFTKEGAGEFFRFCEIAHKAAPKNMAPKLVEIALEIDENDSLILYQDGWQIAVKGGKKFEKSFSSRVVLPFSLNSAVVGA